VLLVDAIDCDLDRTFEPTKGITGSRKPEERDVGRLSIYTLADDCSENTGMFYEPTTFGLRIDVWNASQHNPIFSHVGGQSFISSEAKKLSSGRLVVQLGWKRAIVCTSNHSIVFVARIIFFRIFSYFSVSTYSTCCIDIVLGDLGRLA
jgi:hypothetical protein